MHYLLSILHYFSLFLHPIQRQGLSESQQLFLVSRNSHVVGVLELPDALEEELHINLSDSFFSSLLEAFAVWPIELIATENSLHPVVDSILYVLQESHVRFSNLGLVFEAGGEGAFCHRQLVAILVK